MEVLKAIVAEAAGKIPVTIRISVSEFVESGLDFEDVKRICLMAQGAGAQAVSITAGCYEAIHTSIQPMYVPQGFLIPYAEELKSILSVPVIVAGRLNNASLLESIVEDGKADMVAIHDGARCLITPEDIDRVVSEAAKHGAATAAAKGIDTVKLGTANGFIEKTLDRNHVWMAQTPQVFRTNVYHAALAIAERDGITVTDDCSLAEHIEHPVRLVECSRDNIKLTTKDDIARAEAILRARTEEDRT
jgi:2-C-methyl-D-erythritol 4-phosphate cytidylyltransferase